MVVDNSLAIRKKAKGGACTEKSLYEWYKDYLGICKFEAPSGTGNVRVFVDAFVTTFE
jgi:hypothetical protein